MAKVPDDAVRMDRADLVRALPAELRGGISDDVVDDINSILHEPELRDSFRDNIIGFSTVVREGKFKLPSYLNAVRFVTYRLNGNSVAESWAKTFPERYDKLMDKGASAKRISSDASIYNNTLLVKKIYEQSITPVHVACKDIFYEAISEATHLMRNANSEKVRGDMAATLIKELKPPEKTQVSVEVSEDGATKIIDTLRTSVEALAKQKQEQIQNGVTLTQIGAQKAATTTSSNKND